MNEDVTFRKASLARLLKAALPHGAQLLAAALGLLTFAGVPLGGQAVAQSQFSFDQAGTVTPAAGWQFVTGDFLPGGPTDIIGYHPSNGTLWVGNLVGSEFSLSEWASVTPAARWTFVAGDFVPGGGTDLVGYHPSNGSLWIGTNTGSSFQFSIHGSVTPTADWRFVAGDFVPGGGTDLVGYHPSNGTVWVGTDTGSGFSFDLWATVTPAAGWTFMGGDFVPGGGTDLVGYHPGNGTVWVGTNKETQFIFNRWAEITLAAGWSFVSGDFVSGGGTDLVGYHPNNGTVWVGTNTRCGGFEFTQAATVTPPTDWQFAAGTFTGDPRPDLLGYHQSNGSLWIGSNSGTEQPAATLEGYAWPLSGAPGDTIRFMISGKGSPDVRFFRHRANAAGVTSIPMGTTQFTPAVQPVGPLPWRLGADWNTSFSLTIPDDWPSGLYSAAVTGGDGAEFHITFVVRPDPTERSDLAVLANINTWLAYNDWGCAGKYGGAAQVSFLRPNPYVSPVGVGPGPYHLARGELWILGWLEDEGHRPDVYTDLDFHNGLLADGYKVLVVGTHPEYWSTQMLGHLMAYLSGGGSLLYLGGNGIYENGEYTADQTGMVFLTGVEGGPRADALFRRLPAGSERAVLGVATERCGVVGAGYHAEVPGHPFLQGTGLTGSANEAFGEQGLNTGAGNGAASGWEVDSSNGPGATGIPFECGTEQLPVPPPAALPQGLTVLAKGLNVPGPGADMVTYDHPGGGLVFSVGSITFGGSLVIDPRLQKIVRNVLAEAAAR